MLKYRNNKNFGIIVNLVFNVVRYVLYTGDKHQYLNLGNQMTLVEDARSMSSASQHSRSSNGGAARFGGYKANPSPTPKSISKYRGSSIKAKSPVPKTNKSIEPSKETKQQNLYEILLSKQKKQSVEKYKRL